MSSPCHENPPNPPRLLPAIALLLLLGLGPFSPPPAYAQASAPADQAEPAAPAPSDQAAPAPTPQSCDSKTLEKCTPNSGDTAWMLASVALVLMMTIPGLGLFYGGMVRKKNVGDTVMTSFFITCLVTVLFAVVTYSLAFTAGSPL